MPLFQMYVYPDLRCGDGETDGKIETSDLSYLSRFFCHRHLATLQGRVGRRDQAGDINACGHVCV